MVIFKQQLTHCLRLLVLPLAAFMFVDSVHADVIDKSGQSISGTLSYQSNGVNQYLFTGATLKSNAVLTFGAGAYMTNSNFDQMVLEVNSRMQIGTGYLEMAGLTSFKNMTIGGELVFMDVSGSGSAKNIDLSGSTVLAGGSLSFSPPSGWYADAIIKLDNLQIYGTVAISNVYSPQGFSFKNAYFRQGSVFTTTNVSDFAVDFSGAYFGGTVTIQNLLSGNFTDAKYLAGSKTTLINSIKGTVFNGITLEGARDGLEGAQLILTPSNTSGVVFGAVSIGNGALLYIDGLAYEGGQITDLTGIRVDVGGRLNINSDGWQRDWTKAKFDGAAFNGNVFFGVNDGLGTSNESNYLILNEASFKGSGFAGTTDFKWVNLNSAVFDDAVMNGTVNFTGASNGQSGIAKDISFKKTKFTGDINFTRMNMEGALFNNAELSGNVTFTNTNLTGADFASGDASIMSLSGQLLFDSSTLDKVTFTDVKFSSSSGKKIVFNNSSMTETVFSGVDFSGVVEFNNGNARNAKFIGSYFGGNISFTGTNMSGTDFTRATFDGTVDLMHLTLTDSTFEDASLTGAVIFQGEKNGGTVIDGDMKNSNLKGVYLGSSVQFNSMTLDGSHFGVSSSGRATVIDGATFDNTGLYTAIFSDAIIQGNTSFKNYSWLDSAKFDGASFESANGSRVEFHDAYMANTTFNGTNFNGSVLFYASRWNGGYYNNADFSGAKFNVGSNVIFEGNGASIGSIKTGSTPLYAGTLTFSNVDINGIDFANAIFQSTSNISFSNANVSNAKFSGLTVKAGGELSFSNGATVDNVSFEGATFEQNTTFSFYDTQFVSSSTLNFKNTIFAGITRFSDGSKSTNLSGADFTGASFQWDSTKGTMFFMQNTGLTYDQLKSTKNYNTETGKFDLRGMDISGNANISGNDFRGAQINAANFSGLWANDFRDSTYTSNEPTNYGTSYIAANGNLGGLNNHTSATYNEFVIREKLAGSTTSINLLGDSNRLNSGVTLKIGANNDIFAHGADRGLNVFGTIEMDSSSAFHMRDGASLIFNEGSLLEITVGANENYILIADFDNLSLDLELLQFIVHVQDGESFALMDYEWKLEVMNYYEDNPYNQLILYYAIPEPSTYIGILGIAALALVATRRRRK